MFNNGNTHRIDSLTPFVVSSRAQVRYSHIPEQSLVEFINALCRTLNIEACCQRSWQLMTNVLKSPCGHQGVIALCATLDNPDNVHVVNLLRGAVFYLSTTRFQSALPLWVSHS